MTVRQRLGFGCVGLTTQAFERSALKLLSTAFDEGITHFDTAPIYGNGYSEKILGKFSKKRRHQITIATKFGLSHGPVRKLPGVIALPLNSIRKILKPASQLKTEIEIPVLLKYRKIGRLQIQTDFENSLRNLQTDYIDYYLLHEGMPAFLTEEALLYITELKHQGYIKKIGVAASFVNLYNSEPGTLDQWDILQYENGFFYASDDLIKLWPGKTHFYHSIFKSLLHMDTKPSFKNDITGILLAKAIKVNPEGKALFASSKIQNIKINLQMLDKYERLSLPGLNTVIADAIH